MRGFGSASVSVELTQRPGGSSGRSSASGSERRDAASSVSERDVPAHVADRGDPSRTAETYENTRDRPVCSAAPSSESIYGGIASLSADYTAPGPTLYTHCNYNGGALRIHPVAYFPPRLAPLRPTLHFFICPRRTSLQKYPERCICDQFFPFFCGIGEKGSRPTLYPPKWTRR